MRSMLPATRSTCLASWLMIASVEEWHRDGKPTASDMIEACDISRSSRVVAAGPAEQRDVGQPSRRNSFRQRLGEQPCHRDFQVGNASKSSNVQKTSMNGPSRQVSTACPPREKQPVIVHLAEGRSCPTATGILVALTPSRASGQYSGTGRYSQVQRLKTSSHQIHRQNVVAPSINVGGQRRPERAVARSFHGASRSEADRRPTEAMNSSLQSLSRGLPS